MIEDRIFASFDAVTSAGTLPELCVSLLHEQQHSWLQLSEGYAALKLVRVREVHCDGFSVFLQFNPKRIISSGARVDQQSIRKRACFLCPGNLPPEQKGVLYRKEFLVLCNPAPILDRHYTIAHVRHISQQLDGFLGTFLELAKDLSPTFTVFYNGPKCGASAPDHMHFQAGPSGAIPIEKESGIESRRQLRKNLNAVAVYTLRGLGRQVIVLEGGQRGGIEAALERLIATMRKELGISEEPMVNILCSYRDAGWRLIIFPRRKHRPDIYFRKGNDRVLISPASVDLGGLVVTPIEKDFETVSASMIQDIFNEVSLESIVVDNIIGEL